MVKQSSLVKTCYTATNLLKKRSSNILQKYFNVNSFPFIKKILSSSKKTFYSPATYVTGYTGFVPRSRELIALGYPIQSREGLTMFSHDMKRNIGKKGEESKPTLKREPKLQAQKTTIYPINKGMIPHYTGYIPGNSTRGAE